MANEVLTGFLNESRASVEKLDRDIFSLGDANADQLRISNIFDTLRHIKGLSVLLELSKLEHLVEAGERLLTSLQNGERTPTVDVANGLLSMVDGIRTILANVEKTGAEGEVDYGALVEDLEKMRITGQAASGQTILELLPSTTSALAHDRHPSLVSIEKSSRSVSISDHPFGQSSSLFLQQIQTVVKPVQREGKTQVRRDDQRTSDTVPSEQVTRVEVETLNRILQLIGELAETRSQISQIRNRISDTSLLTISAQLDRVTSDLQRSLVVARMQPLSTVTSKLPNFVQELARKHGKRIQMTFEGTDIEFDKAILDEMKVALIHVIRNCIDHGIESLGGRALCGKPLSGTISVQAFYEAGHVVIEITDDGKGIDHRCVREKAIKRRLITESQAAMMSEQELIQLIFSPGISSRDLIGNLISRASGLGSVKESFESFGGRVSVRSIPEQETTLRMEIPLALAIEPLLVVGGSFKHKSAMATGQ
ncbi:chemotaxis protein CheA [Planctomicrobium sp. SH527]|uniref:chemotaxis protein CheA n=1 Tax=Planctomicrobium sp. SH527 TaxID=3448123 RepID=UPI003F5C1001